MLSVNQQRYMRRQPLDETQNNPAAGWRIRQIKLGSAKLEETPMPTNTQILLDHRPTDKVSPANFRVVDAPVPTPGPGEVLVRHTFLSLDPYMRGRLSNAKSYAKPQEVGAVMSGGTVRVVEASNNPRFHPGDAVVGMGGWQLYALSDGATLRVVDAKAVPIQAYLGPVGMPGVTAWYGLNKIIAPKKGETVLVSAATGAVGSVVGQLAKIAGAWTVGIAGGPEKCAYAAKELGYDAWVDHKSPGFAEELKAAVPNGIDGLFENVGGERSARRCGGSTISPGSRSAVSSPLMKASGRRGPTCCSSSSSASKWRASSSATIWTCGRRLSVNWSLLPRPRS
jgi:hypothetical protein